MLNRLFLSKVSDFITANRLLCHDGKHIVALSGGADSVTLALALRQLGYSVEAAHCNFKLRGDESDRDETFCRTFCRENGIPLHVVHFDTFSFAELHKISIEMAARQLRYSYFEQLRTDINADSICVAHHKDDTVETVLMNLIRGTGVHGLTGIACRNGHIVRPLLCVFRHEIENVLRQSGQSYVTDSTNLEDDVVRNKIRLNIIPILRQINPSVTDSIAATAARITDAAKVFDKAVGESVKRVAEYADDGAVAISISSLKNESAPEYILFSILKDYAFTSPQIESVFRTIDSVSGKTFRSSTHELLFNRGKIIVEPLKKNEQNPLRIPEDGIYVYDKDTKLRVKTVDKAEFSMEKSSSCACLDASSASFPLTVRRAGQGDRFIPFGMRGSKLVSDYLTDRKKSLFEKRRQLVITDASDRIIWLVNERPDNRCRITEGTQKVLCISIIE